MVDAPRVLLHFNHLLVSLVENAFGWITSKGGQSFAFYRSAMQRLKHTVWEPQWLNSRHLGMGIQSERALVPLVFTSSLRNKRPGLSGRPHCKGVAIGVARRGARRSGERTLRVPP